MSLPPIIPLKWIRGDSRTLTCALTLDGVAYDPPVGSIVLFTVKLNTAEEDVDALFQKTLGYGLLLSGSTATVSIVPNDTQFALGDRAKYAADIQVQEPDADGSDVYTVWRASITFDLDATRELTTSVPIYTSNPPLPGTGGLGSVTYTHVQTAEALVWTVDHNLSDLVTVTVFDVFGAEVEAAVTHPTENQAVITFSTPTAGKARVS